MRGSRASKGQKSESPNLGQEAWGHHCTEGLSQASPRDTVAAERDQQSPGLLSAAHVPRPSTPGASAANDTAGLVGGSGQTHRQWKAPALQGVSSRMLLPGPGQVCSEPTMRLCHPRCGCLSRRLCPLPGLSTALPAMWTELLLTAGQSWTVSLPVPRMAESHCAPGARAVLRHMQVSVPPSASHHWGGRCAACPPAMPDRPRTALHTRARPPPPRPSSSAQALTGRSAVFLGHVLGAGP